MSYLGDQPAPRLNDAPEEFQDAIRKELGIPLEQDEYQLAWEPEEESLLDKIKDLPEDGLNFLDENVTTPIQESVVKQPVAFAFGIGVAVGFFMNLLAFLSFHLLR